MFNLKWQTTDTKTNRIVGFIHNIYPTRDLPCSSSCDTIRQSRRINRLSQLDKELNKDAPFNTNFIDSTLLIGVNYIDYSKMLTGNFGINNIEPYLSNMKTRELVKTNPPQALSQELINQQWKTLIIRDLEQIPRVIIKIPSLNNKQVRLMNKNFITDSIKVVPFEYVHYTSLVYLFYRFNFEGKNYLVPAADIKHPVTNKLIYKNGLAIEENLVIIQLKAVTKDYEQDYIINYKPNVEYTR